MGIDNIMRFDWLAPPPAETMVRALESLHALGVLDEDARWGGLRGGRVCALESPHALGVLDEDARWGGMPRGC